MVAAGQPLPRGFDAHELDARVVEKGAEDVDRVGAAADARHDGARQPPAAFQHLRARFAPDHRLEIADEARERIDRKSTRLNSSHLVISYAVFCLKKKKHTADRLRLCSVDRRETVGWWCHPARVGGYYVLELGTAARCPRHERSVRDTLVDIDLS